MNDLQLFMRLYMYELEMWLSDHKKELQSISFQSDEANTDRPLKEYMKKAIETQCNHIMQLKETKSLIINGTNYEVSDTVKNASINSVLLPEEISAELKHELQSRKEAVFTRPDICLGIRINDSLEYETVELKSTKNDSIPGSSVQQITPDEWVIFIKHTSNTVEVTTGQYFCAINSKMQFPDRSPRPQVSFSELLNWNNNYRHDNGDTIEYQLVGDEAKKKALLTDWQGVLAKRWTDIVFDRKPHKSEPWFNNNLRKFILEFLEKYDSMPEIEKQRYKSYLKSQII